MLSVLVLVHCSVLLQLRLSLKVRQVGAGGQYTGLTAVTTGVLFLICLFLAPLVSLVPNEATSPVLIIGALMLGAIRNIDFDDWTEGFPAFPRYRIDAVPYSIANGISAGLIAYPLPKYCRP